jgi:hypothetical protein
MSSAFDDERLQFYLRHRSEIREWGRIERDVVAATIELLSSTQPEIEARIVAVDPTVTSERMDGGKYERILVRRPVWPKGFGVMLEWETSVSPFGSSLPKYGIATFNWDSGIEPLVSRLVAIAKGTASLTGGGYKVPEGRPWPAVRYVPKSKDWWQDPDAWAESVVEAVVGFWPVGVAVIEEGLASQPVLVQAPPSSASEA